MADNHDDVENGDIKTESSNDSINGNDETTEINGQSNKEVENSENKTTRKEMDELGCRALRIVFVCFIINFCVQIIESLVEIGIQDRSLLESLDMVTTIDDPTKLSKTEINPKAAQSVNNYFKSVTNLYAPFGIFLMTTGDLMMTKCNHLKITKSGHWISVILGSLLTCASFAIISFLDVEPGFVWYWKIGICLFAGLGLSILKISALIPVLEFFTSKRMEALLLSRLGFVLGSVVEMGVKFASQDWKMLYRINACLCVIPVVVGVFAFLMDVRDRRKVKQSQMEPKTGSEMELKTGSRTQFKTRSQTQAETESKTEAETGSQSQAETGSQTGSPRESETSAEMGEGCESISNVLCLDKIIVIFPVLKMKMLWTVFGVFSTFKFGTALPRYSQSKISKIIKGQIQSTPDSFADDLTVIIATILGMLLTYLLTRINCLKSYRKKGLVFAFTLVSYSSNIIGFLSAVSEDKVGYHIFFNGVLVALKVISENIRTESMPDVFGLSNIRTTEGLLHFFSGLAEIFAALVQDQDDGWKSTFKIGGGSLLINGLVSQTYVISRIVNSPKKNQNSNDSVANGTSEDISADKNANSHYVNIEKKASEKNYERNCSKSH